VRALKHHGGAPPPAKAEAGADESEFLAKGLANLAANIGIVHQFGVPAVVAVNRFPADMDFEVASAVQGAIDAGAEAACACDVWARGGEGGRDLAHAVVAATSRPSEFRFLYPLEAPLEEKMRAIATRVYGADSVELAPAAAAQVARFEDLGFGSLPVIMAKTPLSLSHDAKRKGVPTAYDLPVRDVRLSAGAGFIYALCGDIMTMPGLSSKPAFMAVDVDEDGQVMGLF
jgi:methylenetetrahydrofolate dehydrogenase (NADP+)/methenyltetrahydrofolate cyclohydrolase/formyltetrahydrofolate synthetase/formate--tetrahydrofolate ligase